MKVINNLFTQPLFETDVNICDAFNWLFHHLVEITLLSRRFKKKYNYLLEMI